MVFKGIRSNVKVLEHLWLWHLLCYIRSNAKHYPTHLSIVTPLLLYTLSKFFLEHKQAHGAEYVCIFLSMKFYYLNPKGMLKPSLWASLKSKHKLVYSYIVILIQYICTKCTYLISWYKPCGFPFYWKCSDQTHNWWECVEHWRQEWGSFIPQRWKKLK